MLERCSVEGRPRHPARAVRRRRPNPPSIDTDQQATPLSAAVQRETPVEPSAGALPSVYQRALALAYRAVLLALVAWAGVQALSQVWHFTIDDAGISYAYARHLAEGEGPVAVVGGPWIEGYSNPLWVFLLALVHLVGLPITEGAKVLGALLLALGLAAGAAWLAISEGRSWRTIGAVEAAFAIAVVLCAELAVWVPAGLENALFMALLLALFWLDAREAEHPEAFGASGLCAFALSITRPEAAMYAAPLVAIKLVQAWRGREPVRQALTAVLAFVLPLGVYHVGHYLVFHEVVPNTYYAKPPWTGGAAYLQSTARESGLVYLLPLALVGVFGRVRRVLLVVWACVAGSAFVLYSGGDWMPHARFLSLFGACVVLLAARGLSRLSQLGVRLGTRLGIRFGGALARREVLGLVLAGAGIVAWGRFQWPRLVALRQRNWCHFCEVARATQKIRKLAAQAHLPSHSLVTQDFGAPSWLSDEGFYPIDFLGLCDRSIVLIRGKRARGGVRNEFRFYQYLLHEQPTPPSWIFVPPNFWPGLDRSIEARDFYRLAPRLLPRARRDSFFMLHRGELVDYFPPVPPGPLQGAGHALVVSGWRLFADPSASVAEGTGAQLEPGARGLALVSLSPLSMPIGTEQVVLEAWAGSAVSSSQAVRFDRGIDGIARQFAVGEPLGFELPVTLPATPAAKYQFTLRVIPGRAASSSDAVPIVVALGELDAGSPLPRFERSLPRYPTALPPPIDPELRALRLAVTTAVEQSRRAGHAAPRDEGLSQRLAHLAAELEARGASDQAYLAAVWATQVDRRAWESLASTVHRLRQVAMDDEHATELVLLRRYYLSNQASDLTRLVAFYLAVRRTFEADYFLQRWSSAAAAELASPVHAALAAELAAQLAGDGRGADSILAQVASDPLGGTGDFESEALDAWQGARDIFVAGPEPRIKGLRGQHGRGILASTQRGDAGTGELTSREFRIEGRHLSLLVGGGTASRKVGVELWVDGQKQLAASGDDSDNLMPVFWDVARFQGKQGRLRVFDRSTSRHVSIDRVLLWR